MGNLRIIWIIRANRGLYYSLIIILQLQTYFNEPSPCIWRFVLGLRFRDGLLHELGISRRTSKGRWSVVVGTTQVFSILKIYYIIYIWIWSPPSNGPTPRSIEGYCCIYIKIYIYAIYVYIYIYIYYIYTQYIKLPKGRHWKEDTECPVYPPPLCLFFFGVSATLSPPVSVMVYTTQKEEIKV